MGFIQGSALSTFSTAGSMRGNVGILWEWLTGVLSTLGGSSSESSLLGDFSSIKRQTLSPWWFLTALHKDRAPLVHLYLAEASHSLFFRHCHLPGNSGHEQTTSSQAWAGPWLLPLWRKNRAFLAEAEQAAETCPANREQCGMLQGLFKTLPKSGAVPETSW